ncbi:MAG: DUF2007 domain-containing protein [Melioribacteraceae bacterium]|nr:DUF2007 domain-containing protein [Melioribacteraceae bacterium]
MNDKDQNYKFYPILKTFSQVDIAMIKSLLDGNVEYYFKDEQFMSIRPMLEPTELMVREDYVDEVKELLADFELNYMAVSLKDDEEEDDFEDDELDDDDEYIL